MENAILQVKGVNISYNKQLILDNFSIELKQGEISSLLGHNGAGKTTAINILLGLTEKMSGEILFKGVKISDQYQYFKSKIGFVPDDDELFDDLTAYEYLQFLGKSRKIPNKDFLNVTNHLLDVFNLYKYKDNLLKTYSHGMRRKIQIISGLIHKPEVLIVDEPTNGLDPDMIITFKELLVAIRNLGTAILISTHNLDFAESISDHVTIIKTGEIKLSGYKSDILKNLEAKNLEEAYIKINLDKNKLNSIRNVFNYDKHAIS